MRIHPSVGQILGRTVPSEGANIGVYRIEPRAEVGIYPWVLHRNPEVFPNLDVSWPERWLVGEGCVDENHLRMMSRSFFSFGHGSHACSGKHISIMEMMKLIPTLFLKYAMEFVEREWDTIS